MALQHHLRQPLQHIHKGFAPEWPGAAHRTQKRHTHSYLDIGPQAKAPQERVVRGITCQVLYPLKKYSLQFSSTKDPPLILMNA